MPRKPKKQTQKAKQEAKLLTSRLLEISVKMDEYIYNKKVIRSCEAKCYLQELNTYEKCCTLDVRSQQVVEKLVNFMQRVIDEEFEELRANGTLGNSEIIGLPMKSLHENYLQTLSFSENRLSSPFDLNRLDGPNVYEGNMNRSVDINGNENTGKKLNESQRIQIDSSHSQINSDQVTLLSQSVLQDHNYTSWEGPKPYHDDDPASNTKRDAFFTEKKKYSSSSILRASQKSNPFTVKPFQNPAVAKKIVLVKIPSGNTSKTPSPAKYIKITATPRRNLNIPPVYVRTPKNESTKATKKVFFSNVSGLPPNYIQEDFAEQMAPKKAAVPIAISPKINANDVNPKKQSKRRSGRDQSDDENVIKRPNKRAKRKSSQETNVSIERATCGRKKRAKNKLKPNEEDLSWVENLKFVRVIEKDENVPNMNITDAFWRNLDYPPDWDDGVYLI